MFGYKLVKVEKEKPVENEEIIGKSDDAAKEEETMKKSGKAKLFGGLVAAGAVVGTVAAVLLKRGGDPASEFEDAEVVSDEADASDSGDISETDFAE